MIEQTLFIIKPGAYKEKLVGKIITKIEESGFKIIKMTIKKLTRKEAENLYDVHR
ncbi:nucleoside-diphosphate kinase, partial [candidate division WOR-3 bacterium]|nr:nucleoside-diphosphate kinase [candidate division WOR-3 bacterium]